MTGKDKIESGTTFVALCWIKVGSSEARRLHLCKSFR